MPIVNKYYFRIQGPHPGSTLWDQVVLVATNTFY